MFYGPFIDHSVLPFFSKQRIRSTVDEKEQKELLMDLDVVMRSNDCPFIVQFYGALFKEVINNLLAKKFLLLSEDLWEKNSLILKRIKYIVNDKFRIGITWFHGDSY